MSRARQMLIFDADDTLWENNVIFERVIDEYLTWLAHPTLDRAEVRAVLNEIEKVNAAGYGYGSKVFLRSLADCVERLNERPVTATERARLDELAAAFDDDRVELIEGVADTLDALGGRHDLLLLTKGDTDEQQRKLDASRLTEHFGGVHIVPEKDAGVYRSLTRRYAWDPASTWMIGNSPKSDILPARQAGMNAVFIPNDNTWVLEHSELDPADRGVLRLHAFPELLEHF